MKKILLVLAMLLAAGSTLLSEKATAAIEWKFLNEGQSAGLTLSSGYYYVTKDITFTGAAAESGLAVAPGNTVYIYIPKGVTLTAIGGSASGRTGAGAGILLPENSALYLQGGGKVVARGGNAANGSNGDNGNDAGWDRNNYWSGRGGNGGNGGGGAGAGIGTCGADGGTGGTGASTVVSHWSHAGGNSGGGGSSGGTASSMGSLYVDAVHGLELNAVGGGSASYGGSGGGAGKSILDDDDTYNYSAAGGGGGGGGGFGGKASDIGTGGPGGGGGGGGASGNLEWSNSGYYVVKAPGGNGGRNANGSSAGTGAQSILNHSAINSGRVISNSSGWGNDDDDVSGQSVGSGGGSGDKGTATQSRPLSSQYLVQFNVMRQFNGTVVDNALYGYKSNTDRGSIKVGIPTTYALGLTRSDEYVMSWNYNSGGDSNPKAAYDEISITSGLTHLYGVWKKYKDIFPEGNGTQTKPFVISNAGLLALADYVNNGGNTRGVYFKQEGNIHVSDILANNNRGSHWTAIGHIRVFEGDYDGGGYIIHHAPLAHNAIPIGLYGEHVSSNGIFGKVLGSIHHLGVEDVSFDTNGVDVRAGAIAGMLVRDDYELTRSGQISNCYVANSVVKSPYSSYVGALVGEMAEGSAMSYCHECGNTLSGTRAGAFCGYVHATAKVDMCFTKGAPMFGNDYRGATNCQSRVSDSSMTGGEITWLLNDKTAFGVTWYQDLSNKAHPDAYPVLDIQSDKVYYDGSKYSNETSGIYALSGEGTTEKPYFVSNAQDLDKIAQYCNGGSKSTGIHFLQTADIDLNGGKLKPIGSINAFDGIYDGGGHAIRNGNITVDAPETTGIFGVVTGTVTRLSVENTTFKSVQKGDHHARAGGIAARLLGNGLISHCFVTGCTVACDGTGVAGGIVSDMFDQSVVRNCFVYKTTVSGSRTGQICSDTKAGTRIIRCYSDGSSLVSNDHKGSIESSYAKQSANTLASGEIAYELNNKSNEEHIWYQTIGVDESPVLSSDHAMVFKIDGVITNDYYDIARLGAGTKENPYKVVTPQDLWDIVVSIAIMQRSDFYIKQMADIDGLDSIAYPIGTGTRGFEGHYDGGGHVIRNVNVRSYLGSSLGIFNQISGTVERLGIENCTFLADANTTRLGAFAGKMTGKGVLRNCYVKDCSIDYNKIPGVVVGGLVGEQTDESLVESCFGYNNTVLGQKDGSRQYGDVVGYIGANASARNVFTDGSSLCAEGQAGAKNILTSDQGVSDLRFKTGEISYLLNGSKSDNPVWYQTIKTDTLPVLNSNRLPVYGYTRNEQTLYTNSKEVPQMVSLTLYSNDGSNNNTAMQIFREVNDWYVPEFNLAPYTKERKYYYFAGWNTKSNGKGTFYPYNAGLRPTDHLSLYAVWQMKVPADGKTNVVELPSDTAFFKLFDDGGYNIPYGKNSKGKLTLVAPKDKVVLLTGTVTTEALGTAGKPTDYLTVYDGDAKSTKKLTNAHAKTVDTTTDVFFSSMNGAKEDIGKLMSTGETITIEFVTDAENNYYGLDLMATVLPKEIRALGQGTEEDPFEVADYDGLSTVNEYIQLTGDSKVFIRQTDDIDLEDEIFTPLASGVESFEGHYDGGGYTIQNLTVDQSTDEAVGFFRNVSGVVEHLGIVNSNFKGVKDGVRVGAFAGQLSGSGQLRHCYAKDNNFSYSGATGTVGVLVGEQTDTARIVSCYAYNNMYSASADDGGQRKYGALAGEVKDAATQEFAFSDEQTSDYSFRNGEVCFALNSSLSDSVVWRQTIGTDTLPVFDASSQNVYKHEDQSITGYTNNSTSTLMESRLVDIATEEYLTLSAFKDMLVNLGAITPEHKYFLFKGWNTKGDGSGTFYPKDSIFMYTEPLELYAQYDMVVDMAKDDNEKIEQIVPTFIPFAKVYDDGGSDSTYTAGARYVTLVAPEGSVLQVKGTVASRTVDGSAPEDYLAVYDGIYSAGLKDGQRVGNANAVSGDGWKNVYYSTKTGEPYDIGTLSSSGRELTILFHTGSQTDTACPGIDLTVTAVPVDSVVKALGKGTEEEPYFVYTAADLKNLAAYGKKTGKANYSVKQTTDVDMEGVTMLPLFDDELPFAGHYNGDGHVISNMTIDGYEGNSLGLFGTVSGTVERVGLENSTVKAVTADTRLGILAGRLTGSAQLRYCFVKGSTISSGNVNSIAGTFVGEQADRSGIESCYGFQNTVSGWTEGANKHFGYITGNMAATATQKFVVTDGASFCADGQNVQGISDCQNGLSAEAFFMGEACYLLNDPNSTEVVWRQTLGSDDLPVLNPQHDVVYRHQVNESFAYSNEPVFQMVKLRMVDIFDSNANQEFELVNGSAKKLGDLTSQSERFVFTGWSPQSNGTGANYKSGSYFRVNGDVTLYSQWQMVAKGTEDDPYKVAISADLKNLAQYVYYMGRGDLHVEQVADVDMKGEQMRPIGSMATPFSGVYNGWGHAISNATIQTNADQLAAGVFGTVTGRVIRLGVANSTIEGVDDDARIGGIAGRLTGNGVIGSCYVNGCQIVSDKTSVAGAIVADMFEQASVERCFVYKTTLKASRTGHICSDMAAGTSIQYCYTDGNSLVSNAANGTVKDCESDQKDSYFKSGRICYQLNGKQSDGVSWCQTIGTDSLPVSDFDHKIVYCYRSTGEIMQTKYSNNFWGSDYLAGAEKVTIRLFYDNGTNQSSSFSVFRQQYDFEEELAFPLGIVHPEFPESYSSDFIGWSETRDGKGAFYKPNDIVKPYSDINLYAQWDNVAYCIPQEFSRDIELQGSVVKYKVYDHAGPQGTYGWKCNGTLTLIAPENKILKISGTVRTQAPGSREPSDYLAIYDGQGRDNHGKGNPLRNEYAKTSDLLTVPDAYYASSETNVAESIGTICTPSNKAVLQFVSYEGYKYEGLDLTVEVSDPIYYIDSREDFMAYAGLKADVYLNQDVDLGSWDDVEIKVQGNFDGNGHTVTYTGNQHCTGLFYEIEEGASVKHLRVKANVVTSSSCGGIANTNRGIISDCHFSGTIRNDSWWGKAVASITLNGTFDHCSATGEMVVEADEDKAFRLTDRDNYRWTNSDWVNPDDYGNTRLTEYAEKALAEYPVYARGILDVTQPKIILGDQTIDVKDGTYSQLTIVDGQRFSSPTGVKVNEITYKRNGTNGDYEPWILPFNYTIDGDMFKPGVEFYRFTKDQTGAIQAVQIAPGSSYQAKANEPMAFRASGSDEYAFQMKYVANGNKQPLTISMAADGTAATLASTNDVARIKASYEGVSADKTVKGMMHVWNSSKENFVLSDGTEDLKPFRYYLQYVDKSTGNYERYEDTDWARRVSAGAPQHSLAKCKAARRAPLSSMTDEGWQAIILDPRGSQEVTADMLADYEILGLWDLYDVASAPGADNNDYAVSVIYAPVEEGMTLPYAVPLLVRAKHADAKPLVTEEMAREIEAELEAAAEGMSEDDLMAAFEEIHYWCSTFDGRYDVWQFALPEKDSLMNDYGALLFTDTGNDQYFTRIPAADRYSMKPMSYCFTAYDARTFENLPLAKDRIEIVVLDPSEILGIETVEADGSAYSRRNGAAINLSGQKVDDKYRGIVIKNGRKVLRR